MAGQTWVVLIRGVNVGGRKLAMTELREAAEACGLAQCRTYIQSGNLVGREVGDHEPADLAETLGREIETRVGFRPAVVLRTVGEIRDVVRRNPFLPDADAKDLHVVFFTGAAPKLTDLDRFSPERTVTDGRELYLYLPFGMGRSPMMQAIGRRKPIADGTARNWRTVLTLADMAAELANDTAGHADRPSPNVRQSNDSS